MGNDQSAAQGAPQATRAEDEEVRVHGYAIRKVTLPKGWETIDSDGLVQKVRSALPTDGYQIPESRIVRFLIGHEMDVEKCITLLKDYLEWRLKIDYDTVLRTAQELGPDNLPNKDDLVFPVHPIIGYGPQGQPVLLMRCGMMDIPKAKVLEGDPEALRRTQNFANHYNALTAWTASNRGDAERRLTACIVIYDMKGIGMKHAWNGGLLKRVLKPMVEETTKYYVETAERTFICNAGTAFKALWAIVSMWINKRVKSKVVFSTGTPDEIYQFASRDVLPPDMGGTNVKYALPDYKPTPEDLQRMAEAKAAAETAKAEPPQASAGSDAAVAEVTSGIAEIGDGSKI